ncbi:unnamed protein product [Nezara viridula]|uniref:Uncharacterized protein n=1 Tax=Nezara viridula TaxID=85310 RepID=A0A9P0HA51_NEZVI|nr:unnamed protein product [Nezara viridula]
MDVSVNFRRWREEGGLTKGGILEETIPAEDSVRLEMAKADSSEEVGHRFVSTAPRLHITAGFLVPRVAIPRDDEKKNIARG